MQVVQHKKVDVNLQNEEEINSVNLNVFEEIVRKVKVLEEVDLLLVVEEESLVDSKVEQQRIAFNFGTGIQEIEVNLKNEKVDLEAEKGGHV